MGRSVHSGRSLSSREDPHLGTSRFTEFRPLEGRCLATGRRAPYPLDVDPLHKELSRFLREMCVEREERVLVAVSAGADSVALLHGLASIGQRVAVGHVHHGLRGAAADADLVFVRDLCAELGVEFRAEHVDATRRDGRSPEARARELRYSALERIRRELRCAWTATAHSTDDQAETVLLRSIRGSGLAGLAGIQPRLESARVLRPTLGLPRALLRDYLRRRGLVWREDRTNADVSIPRNRLRIEVLPLLEQVHSGATRKLAELARVARESEEAAHDEVERALTRATSRGDGGVWLVARELAALGAEARRRAWRLLLAREGLADRVTSVHLRRAESFCSKAAGAPSLSLPRQYMLFRDGARVWLGPSPGPRFPAPVCEWLGPEDRVEFRERDVRLSFRQADELALRGNALILPARPTPMLKIRSPQSGDRVLLRGRSAPKPLDDLFRRARWNKSERARALLVERAGDIVWVPGLTAAASSCESASGALQLVVERLSSPAQS